MAARQGREARISAQTLPLIIKALRLHADELTVASQLGTAEYQVREWSETGSLIRELAVCRDFAAANGALDAAAEDRPHARLTLGQKARIIRKRGPEE